jgi:DNA invertase Pin-like site-specific DNA recombinase
MFRDASKRKFDHLLFWPLDRLSREGGLETLATPQPPDQLRSSVGSLTEQYLDSTGMFRDAVVSILAVIARQERVRLSERAPASLERAREAGEALVRPRADVDGKQIRALRETRYELGSDQ